MRLQVNTVFTIPDYHPIFEAVKSFSGHQIIARSLFGMAAVRKRVMPKIGWPDIQIVCRDSLFGESGRTIHSFIFHYDEVCALPEEKAKVIA